MKAKLFLFLFGFFLLVSCNDEKSTLQIRSLNWTLHDVSDSIRITGADPSDVHLALIKEGIIADPFFRANENKLQWVGNTGWIFETEFDLPAHIIQQENVDLVFEGLDTYASVYLNGKQILQANNMFRQWMTDVKTLLKRNNNTMKIVFASPLEINRKKQALLSYNLPEIRGFTRKAAYQSGWDWGPRFVTMGVWRPAYLEAWSTAKIKDVFIQQQSVTTSKAFLSALFSVAASRPGIIKALLFHGEKRLIEKEFPVEKGVNRLAIPFVIDHPELWWPNGMGDAHLYNFRVVLQVDGKQIDEKWITTGLRDIELVQETDSIGKSFYFKVNGKPLFIKGANYIPQDNFLPRVSDEKYEQLFQTVVASHMNMLRVWGGGIYESNLFYELCDQHGILVWQDFMFAGNVYPGDAAFMENVKYEARQNIKRLRNHPCIALWCGNNEIKEAWHNWDWQKTFNYSTEDSTEIWNNYRHLFEEMLPTLVKKYHPGSFYWPSSPSTGWGNDEAFQQGDVHYWGVWWGREPFAAYENHVGRFNSEYGFQGMPDMKTIESFTLPKDRKVGSAVMDVHQKHAAGWETIQQYMERNYRIPVDFENYNYISQLLQADGLKTAIEAHRRARPYSMGSLYWQLNDCWPVTSWSTMDYYGRWKASQYAVKEAYRMCLVSFEEDENGVGIYAVTDDYRDKKVLMKWSLQTFDGDIEAVDSSSFLLPAITSMIAVSLPNSILPKGKKRTETVLVAELWYGNNMLFRGLHYFAKSKDLKLKKPVIKMEIEQIEGKYYLHLSTDKLAKNVFLSASLAVRFEENFFDLLPGEKKQVWIQTRETNLSLEHIRVQSLVDTY